jgi:hypothetical protein
MGFWNKNKQPIVLGKQFADAQEKEAQRIATGANLQSPLPEKDYSFKERTLLFPEQNELDRELTSVVRKFIKLSAPEREVFRKRVSLTQFYSLLRFAERHAVFALREKSADLLRDGLNAIAVIEMERTDYRDILGVLSLLSHTARRIGLEPDNEIKHASQFAEPNNSKLLSSFVFQSEDYKDIAKSWGFKEIHTSSGPGFVGWGFRNYTPTVDLFTVALDIRAIVDSDKYTMDDPTLATDLPGVWFGKNQISEIKTTLSDVIATITMHGNLDKQYDVNAKYQGLIVFLAEFGSVKSARFMFDVASKLEPKTGSILPVVVGQLLCIIVARSFASGIESVENADSLKRFGVGITEALEKTAFRK